MFQVRERFAADSEEQEVEDGLAVMKRLLVSMERAIRYRNGIRALVEEYCAHAFARIRAENESGSLELRRPQLEEFMATFHQNIDRYLF